MDETSISETFAALSGTYRGCEYYKVDLHIHSPASHDFAQEVADSGVKKALRTMTPEDFVAGWVDAGYELIAITDHNSGEFLDAATEAANALGRRKGARRLTVLPGVELTVSGIHLLAIFESGGTTRINDLLSALELSPENRGKEQSFIDKGIADIVSEVRKRGGILIGAHCNSSNGVIHELDGQNRMKYLELLDALENSTKCANPGKTVEYVRNALGCPLPFVSGSDNHDPRTISDTMWIKMAKPNFDGLKQLVFEPELRISLTPPVQPAHPRILGCTTSHGLYGVERFAFSSGLNVLIGGRGAGKSALIDLLRFAFEVEPIEKDDRATFFHRIAGFLQNVGEVVVAVVGIDGETYAIARSGGYTPHKAGPQFEQRPRIYQVLADGVIERDVSPREVLPVEFYGQGEVANLTTRLDEQMRLIDENLDVTDLKDAEISCQKELSGFEETINTGNDKLEELSERAAPLDQLKGRQKQLGEKLKAAVFEKKKLWDREKNLLDAGREWIQNAAGSAGTEPPELRLPAIKQVDTPSVELIRRATAALDSLNEVLHRSRAEALAEVEKTAQVLEELNQAWNAGYLVQHELYLAELAELGAANLAAVQREEASVSHEIERIENTVLPDRDSLAARLAEAADNRRKQLNALAEARRQLRERRLALVNELNAQLGGIVKIEFDDSGGRGPYTDLLNQLLEGSKMHNKASQIEDLCDAMSPAELVDAARRGDVAVLSETGGLTPGNVTIIQRELDERALMQIERIDTPATPRVLLRREGETSYSELHKLSVGEKCSAVLSVALLNKRKPLVIDQPEDELDHAFVTQSIVETIRSVKNVRQIIAATRNPNIPVLGDAEMIFRVSRRAGVDICEIKVAGGLEDPPVTAEVQMLEGGPEAFERRRRKYGK